MPIKPSLNPTSIKPKLIQLKRPPSHDFTPNRFYQNHIKPIKKKKKHELHTRDITNKLPIKKNKYLK